MLNTGTQEKVNIQEYDQDTLTLSMVQDKVDRPVMSLSIQSFLSSPTRRKTTSFSFLSFASFFSYKYLIPKRFWKSERTKYIKSLNMALCHCSSSTVETSFVIFAKKIHQCQSIECKLLIYSQLGDCMVQGLYFRLARVSMQNPTNKHSWLFSRHIFTTVYNCSKHFPCLKPSTK